MKKIDELQTALETVEIDLRATKQQRDRARALYDEAAINQDRHGVKAHGDRWDQCEDHLKELREKRSSLDGELRRERNVSLDEAWALLTDDEKRAFIQKWRSDNPN